MCCLGGNVIIATAQLFNKNIVIDTKLTPRDDPTTVQNRVFRISLKMARTCKKVGEWGFRVDFNSNPHKTKESG
jgi:hypothetical protein